MDTTISRASDTGRAHHIVIVDDDQPIRDAVGDYLRMHGFSVSLCDGGASLRKTIAARTADLIMLDLRMPGEDGLSIMRDLKRRTRIPIIALTAIADASILEMGFDDYIAKPYQPRELLARVRVALQRNAAMPMPPPPEPTGQGSASAVAKPSLVRFGTKWLDLDAQVLRDGDGNEDHLSGPEYSLLKVFAENPNRVLARERLLDLAPTGRSEPFDRSIDVRIMRIRLKIEPDPALPMVIRTVRGGGYKFVPDAGFAVGSEAASVRSSRKEASES